MDPMSSLRESARCPLYIGATAWPSQEDEERVDAAYKQAGGLGGGQAAHVGGVKVF